VSQWWWWWYNLLIVVDLKGKCLLVAHKAMRGTLGGGSGVGGGEWWWEKRRSVRGWLDNLLPTATIIMYNSSSSS